MDEHTARRAQGESSPCHYMERVINIGLVGAGMFGGDVHMRAYADLQRAGISGQLARLGFDSLARELAPVKFQLAALATRREASSQRAAATFREWTGCAPRVYFGETPWVELLRENKDLDVLAVATPDNLHTAAILAALEAGVHVERIRIRKFANTCIRW